jgi:GGDEF domain-containing protein
LHPRADRLIKHPSGKLAREVAPPLDVRVLSPVNLNATDHHHALVEQRVPAIRNPGFGGFVCRMSVVPVSRLKLSDTAAVTVTFSAGTATTTSLETLETLIARADRAMYEDKRRLTMEPPRDEGAVH